ncbi:MAG: glycosyl hydrolase, partial [Deltaproteobacteria bacterium]|nr:glycosyl hydrolase [Deltaproteobacteria bacterium]
FWLKDVAFSDENNGWIVGAMGTVARSTDGGESWELISGMSYDMPEYGLADF